MLENRKNGICPQEGDICHSFYMFQCCSWYLRRHCNQWAEIEWLRDIKQMNIQLRSPTWKHPWKYPRTPLVWPTVLV